MSRSRWSRRLLRCSLPLATAIALAAPVAAQSGVAVRQPRNSCTVADKVRILSFAANNTKPLVGVPVTITLRFQSLCPAGTDPINVTWSIERNNVVIGQGTEPLAAGATASKTANFTATAGTHNFWPATKVGTETDTADDVVVTTFAERFLKHGEGNEANNPEGGSTCQQLGQFDAEASPWFRQRGTTFAATCSGVPPTGGKANPEAYGGLTLQNGWKVVDVEQIEGNKSTAGWSWVTKPAIGGTNPHAKVHVWANAGGKVDVYVRVLIRGEAAKNPF